MNVPTCRHIKTNGIQCKSPALSEGDWCFFHNRLHQRHSSYRHTQATQGYLIPGQHIQLSPLEDRESVQLALSMVVNALATGRLETKRATTLLYGLQLASTNAANLDLEPSARSVVRIAESTLDGLDLAEPGATVDLNPQYDWKADLDDWEEDDEDDDE